MDFFKFETICFIIANLILLYLFIVYVREKIRNINNENNISIADIPTRESATQEMNNLRTISPFLPNIYVEQIINSQYLSRMNLMTLNRQMKDAEDELLKLELKEKQKEEKEKSVSSDSFIL